MAPPMVLAKSAAPVADIAGLRARTGRRARKGHSFNTQMCAQQKALRGCTALPVLRLPIGPACPNAPPEGAAGSAGGAMGASCESGELCRGRGFGRFQSW